MMIKGLRHLMRSYLKEQVSNQRKLQKSKLLIYDEHLKKYVCPDELLIPAIKENNKGAVTLPKSKKLLGLNLLFKKFVNPKLDLLVPGIKRFEHLIKDDTSKKQENIRPSSIDYFWGTKRGKQNVVFPLPTVLSKPSTEDTEPPQMGWAGQKTRKPDSDPRPEISKSEFEPDLGKEPKKREPPKKNKYLICGKLKQPNKNREDGSNKTHTMHTSKETSIYAEEIVYNEENCYSDLKERNKYLKSQDPMNDVSNTPSRSVIKEETFVDSLVKEPEKKQSNNAGIFEIISNKFSNLLITKDPTTRESISDPHGGINVFDVKFNTTSLRNIEKGSDDSLKECIENKSVIKHGTNLKSNQSKAHKCLKQRPSTLIPSEDSRTTNLYLSKDKGDKPNVVNKLSKTVICKKDMFPSESSETKPDEGEPFHYKKEDKGKDENTNIYLRSKKAKVDDYSTNNGIKDYRTKHECKSAITKKPNTSPIESSGSSKLKDHTALKNSQCDVDKPVTSPYNYGTRTKKAAWRVKKGRIWPFRCIEGPKTAYLQKPCSKATLLTSPGHSREEFSSINKNVIQEYTTSDNNHANSCNCSSTEKSKVMDKCNETNDPQNPESSEYKSVRCNIDPESSEKLQCITQKDFCKRANSSTDLNKCRSYLGFKVKKQSSQTNATTEISLKDKKNDCKKVPQAEVLGKKKNEFKTDLKNTKKKDLVTEPEVRCNRCSSTDKSKVMDKCNEANDPQNPESSEYKSVRCNIDPESSEKSQCITQKDFCKRANSSTDLNKCRSYLGFKVKKQSSQTNATTEISLKDNKNDCKKVPQEEVLSKKKNEFKTDLKTTKKKDLVTEPEVRCKRCSSTDKSKVMDKCNEKNYPQNPESSEYKSVRCNIDPESSEKSQCITQKDFCKRANSSTDLNKCRSYLGFKVKKQSSQTNATTEISLKDNKNDCKKVPQEEVLSKKKNEFKTDLKTTKKKDLITEPEVRCKRFKVSKSKKIINEESTKEAFKKKSQDSKELSTQTTCKSNASPCKSKSKMVPGFRCKEHLQNRQQELSQRKSSTKLFTKCKSKSKLDVKASNLKPKVGEENKTLLYKIKKEHNNKQPNEKESHCSKQSVSSEKKDVKENMECDSGKDMSCMNLPTQTAQDLDKTLCCKKTGKESDKTCSDKSPMPHDTQLSPDKYTVPCHKVEENENKTKIETGGIGDEHQSKETKNKEITIENTEKHQSKETTKGKNKCNYTITGTTQSKKTHLYKKKKYFKSFKYQGKSNKVNEKIKIQNIYPENPQNNKDLFKRIKIANVCSKKKSSDQIDANNKNSKSKHSICTKKGKENILVVSNNSRKPQKGEGLTTLNKSVSREKCSAAIKTRKLKPIKHVLMSSKSSPIIQPVKHDKEYLSKPNGAILNKPSTANTFDNQSKKAKASKNEMKNTKIFSLHTIEKRMTEAQIKTSKRINTNSCIRLKEKDVAPDRFSSSYSSKLNLQSDKQKIGMTKNCKDTRVKGECTLKNTEQQTERNELKTPNWAETALIGKQMTGFSPSLKDYQYFQKFLTSLKHESKSIKHEPIDTLRYGKNKANKNDNLVPSRNCEGTLVSTKLNTVKEYSNGGFKIFDSKHQYQKNTISFLPKESTSSNVDEFHKTNNITNILPIKAENASSNKREIQNSNKITNEGFVVNDKFTDGKFISNGNASSIMGEGVSTVTGFTKELHKTEGSKNQRHQITVSKAQLKARDTSNTCIKPLIQTVRAKSAAATESTNKTVSLPLKTLSSWKTKSVSTINAFKRHDTVTKQKIRTLISPKREKDKDSERKSFYYKNSPDIKSNTSEMSYNPPNNISDKNQLQFTKNDISVNKLHIQAKSACSNKREIQKSTKITNRNASSIKCEGVSSVTGFTKELPKTEVSKNQRHQITVSKAQIKARDTSNTCIKPLIQTVPAKNAAATESSNETVSLPLKTLSSWKTKSVNTINALQLNDTVNKLQIDKTKVDYVLKEDIASKTPVISKYSPKLKTKLINKRHRKFTIFNNKKPTSTTKKIDNGTCEKPEPKEAIKPQLGISNENNITEKHDNKMHLNFITSLSSNQKMLLTDQPFFNKLKPEPSTDPALHINIPETSIASSNKANTKGISYPKQSARQPMALIKQPVYERPKSEPSTKNVLHIPKPVNGMVASNKHHTKCSLSPKQPAKLQGLLKEQTFYKQSKSKPSSENILHISTPKAIVVASNEDSKKDIASPKQPVGQLRLLMEQPLFYKQLQSGRNTDNLLCSTKSDNIVKKLKNLGENELHSVKSEDNLVASNKDIIRSVSPRKQPSSIRSQLQRKIPPKAVIQLNVKNTVEE